MAMYVGRNPFHEVDSFTYFRSAVFGSYGNYTSYKYIEESGSWIVFSELTPEVVIIYSIEKGSAEETVFLAEKAQVEAWSGRKRIDIEYVVPSLGDIEDVDVASGLDVGDHLEWDGDNWVPGALDSGDGQKVEDYCFCSEGDREGPKINSGYPTYEIIGRFAFRGTSAIGTPTNIKVVGRSYDSNDYWDVRVRDITNNNTICSLYDYFNETVAVIDLGTLSNLPTGEAVWELQGRKSETNGGYGLISSLHIYY